MDFLWLLVVSCCCLTCGLQVSASAGEGEVPGVDDGTAFKYHSFQVEARAGEQECFYQMFDHNTTLALIWQVMAASGSGELAATVTLKREPDMRILYESAYGQMGDHRESNLDEGTYEICIDNESSYTRKVVYLWIDYQTMKAWDGAVSEDSAVQKYQLKQDLVRDILRTLQSRLHDMTYYQTVYSQSNFYDEAVLIKLYGIVHQRSLIASLVIIVSSLVQVFFIRKLFHISHKTTNAGI